MNPLDAIEPEVWRRLFTTDPDGQRVIEALLARYVFIRLDVPGDPYASHVNIGAANLVNDIACRLG